MSEELIVTLAVSGGVFLILMLGYVILRGDSQQSRVKRRLEHAGKDDSRDASLSPEAMVAASVRRAQARQSQLRGLDSFVDSFLPNPRAIKQRLMIAGLSITPPEYVVGIVVLVAAAFGGGIYFGLPLYVAIIVSLLVGAGLPHMIVLARGKSRQKAFLRQLPDALDLMVRMVRSGLPVTQAMINIGEEMAAPLGPEFAEIANQMRLGKNLDEAMGEANHRMKIQEFNFLTVSLVLQSQTGGNISETLQSLADIIRARHLLKMKISAMSAEARTSAYIIGALPVLLFFGLSAMNPDFMAPLTATEDGHFLIAISITMVVLGALVMWRMVSFEI